MVQGKPNPRRAADGRPRGGQLMGAVFVCVLVLGGCVQTDSSVPRREAFLGGFALAHDPGEPGFEVFLEPDGSAWSTAAGPGTVTRGTWSFESGVARLQWEDGWRNELSRDGEGWIQKSWPPGQTFSDPPLKTTAARRIESRDGVRSRRTEGRASVGEGADQGL